MSAALRRMGWVRFWIQLALGVVVVGVLLFNNIGGRLAANSPVPWGWAPVFRSPPSRSLFCSGVCGNPGWWCAAAVRWPAR